MKREEKTRFILEKLKEAYPDAQCGLRYQGKPERLVIATILSAQTTDAAVNRATPGLWENYPDMASLSEADSADVEELLKTIGLFRTKTRSITGAARYIRDNGLPQTIEGLVKIPGVGRKTANVITGEVFGIPSITVDTHVKRLSGRLGLCESDKPERIEKELKSIIPEEEQTMFSHRLIAHGRQVCHARKPMCSSCSLATICSFHEKRGPEEPLLKKR